MVSCASAVLGVNFLSVGAALGFGWVAERGRSGKKTCPRVPASCFPSEEMQPGSSAALDAGRETVIALLLQVQQLLLLLLSQLGVVPALDGGHTLFLQLL